MGFRWCRAKARHHRTDDSENGAFLLFFLLLGRAAFLVLVLGRAAFLFLGFLSEDSAFLLLGRAALLVLVLGRTACLFLFFGCGRNGQRGGMGGDAASG